MCEQGHVAPVRLLDGSEIEVDKCMAQTINMLKKEGQKKGFKTKACCCGHGKYPKTVVVDIGNGHHIEWFTGVEIPRKRNFYRKDEEGLYFIPETVGD